MKIIEGGVCAPKGFKASGIHCGIRKNKSKKDIALIVSDYDCAAAAVYTTNLVKGAPIAVTKNNLADGRARAVICNSGNANTCNADGEEKARKMCALVEQYTGISSKDVIVASTGVIGQPFDVTPIETGMEALVSALSENGSLSANEAIMTTDTITKEIAVEFTAGGKKCAIGGIAKGSGMIHPNMATMLVFITTDVAITPELLQKAISEDVKTSFNMVSVDGDTSTNDMLSALASGAAGNAIIETEGVDYSAFKEALHTVTVYLCRLIAKDGEGATKLLECTVSGAKDYDSAAKAAKSVITSSLLKAAMFGADANWGRVLCALGYAGAELDITEINVDFASDKGTVAVCRNGAGVDFSEAAAKEILSANEIKIEISLGNGEYSATAWGCDLTYDYVRINGDYRT